MLIPSQFGGIGGLNDLLAMLQGAYSGQTTPGPGGSIEVNPRIVNPYLPGTERYQGGLHDAANRLLNADREGTLFTPGQRAAQDELGSLYGSTQGGLGRLLDAIQGLSGRSGDYNEPMSMVRGAPGTDAGVTSRLSQYVNNPSSPYLGRAADIAETVPTTMGTAGRTGLGALDDILGGRTGLQEASSKAYDDSIARAMSDIYRAAGQEDVARSPRVGIAAGTGYSPQGGVRNPARLADITAKAAENVVLPMRQRQADQNIQNAQANLAARQQGVNQALAYEDVEPSRRMGLAGLYGGLSDRDRAAFSDALRLGLAGGEQQFNQGIGRAGALSGLIGSQLMQSMNPLQSALTGRMALSGLGQSQLQNLFGMGQDYMGNAFQALGLANSMSPALRGLLAQRLFYNPSAQRAAAGVGGGPGGPSLNDVIAYLTGQGGGGGQMTGGPMPDMSGAPGYDYGLWGDNGTYLGGEPGAGLPGSGPGSGGGGLGGAPRGGGGPTPHPYAGGGPLGGGSLPIPGDGMGGSGFDIYGPGSGRPMGGPNNNNSGGFPLPPPGGWNVTDNSWWRPANPIPTSGLEGMTDTFPTLGDVGLDQRYNDIMGEGWSGGLDTVGNPSGELAYGELMSNPLMTGPSDSSLWGPRGTGTPSGGTSDYAWSQLSGRRNIAGTDVEPTFLPGGEVQWRALGEHNIRGINYPAGSIYEGASEPGFQLTPMTAAQLRAAGATQGSGGGGRGFPMPGGGGTGPMDLTQPIPMGLGGGGPIEYRGPGGLKDIIGDMQRGRTQAMGGDRSVTNPFTPAGGSGLSTLSSGSMGGGGNYVTMPDGSLMHRQSLTQGTPDETASYVAENRRNTLNSLAMQLSRLEGLANGPTAYMRGSPGQNKIDADVQAQIAQVRRALDYANSPAFDAEYTQRMNAGRPFSANEVPTVPIPGGQPASAGGGLGGMMSGQGVGFVSGLAGGGMGSLSSLGLSDDQLANATRDANGNVLGMGRAGGAFGGGNRNPDLGSIFANANQSGYSMDELNAMSAAQREANGPGTPADIAGAQDAEQQRQWNLISRGDPGSSPEMNIFYSIARQLGPGRMDEAKRMAETAIRGLGQGTSRNTSNLGNIGVDWSKVGQDVVANPQRYQRLAGMAAPGPISPSGGGNAHQVSDVNGRLVDEQQQRAMGGGLSSLGQRMSGRTVPMGGGSLNTEGGGQMRFEGIGQRLPMPGSGGGFPPAGGGRSSYNTAEMSAAGIPIPMGRGGGGRPPTTLGGPPAPTGHGDTRDIFAGFTGEPTTGDTYRMTGGQNPIADYVNSLPGGGVRGGGIPNVGGQNYSGQYPQGQPFDFAQGQQGPGGPSVGGGSQGGLGGNLPWAGPGVRPPNANTKPWGGVMPTVQRPQPPTVMNAGNASLIRRPPGLKLTPPGGGGMPMVGMTSGGGIRPMGGGLASLGQRTSGRASTLAPLPVGTTGGALSAPGRNDILMMSVQRKRLPFSQPRDTAVVGVRG